MEYKFLQADETMIDSVYELFIRRIEWMDRVGIKQWNVTNYIHAYPKEYYKMKIKEKQLYVISDNGKILGAIVLLEDDERWDDCNKCSAYYLHNFVTDTKIKGIGKIILEFVEELAIKNNKSKLRLDCAEDNDFLNNYYENAGFVLVGKCAEGLYKGNKREKNLSMGRGNLALSK